MHQNSTNFAFHWCKLVTHPNNSFKSNLAVKNLKLQQSFDYRSSKIQVPLTKRSGAKICTPINMLRLKCSAASPKRPFSNCRVGINGRGRHRPLQRAPRIPQQPLTKTCSIRECSAQSRPWSRHMKSSAFLSPGGHWGTPPPP